MKYNETLFVEVSRYKICILIDFRSLFGHSNASFWYGHILESVSFKDDGNAITAGAWLWNLKKGKDWPMREEFKVTFVNDDRFCITGWGSSINTLHLFVF